MPKRWTSATIGARPSRNFSTITSPRTLRETGRRTTTAGSPSRLTARRPAALYSYAYATYRKANNITWKVFPSHALGGFGQAICSAGSGELLPKPSPGCTRSVFRATPLDMKAEADLHFSARRQSDHLPRLALHGRGRAVSRLELLRGGVFDETIRGGRDARRDRAIFPARQLHPAAGNARQRRRACILPNSDAWAKLRAAASSALNAALVEDMRAATVKASVQSPTRATTSISLTTECWKPAGRADHGSLLFGQSGRGESSRGQSNAR